MKSLWLIVAAGLVILASRISYDAGQSEQRKFEALCMSPGVRCVIQFAPRYLLAHHGEVEVMPWAWSAEWLDDERGAQ